MTTAVRELRSGREIINVHAGVDLCSQASALRRLTPAPFRRNLRFGYSLFERRGFSNCSLSPASLSSVLEEYCACRGKRRHNINQVRPIPQEATWLLKNPGFHFFPLEFRPSGSHKTKTPARTEHQPVRFALRRTSSCASCMPRSRHSVSLGGL